jgi:predicted permease
LKRPPRLAVAILERVVPREEREFCLGDLEEQFHDRAANGMWRARLWYWRQTMTHMFSDPSSSPSMDNRSHPSRERLGSLLADIRFGLRQLRRTPGFTITALLTLAIGIGANVAIFSVLNALLLRPLPFQDPDRLMRTYLRLPMGSGQSIEMFWSYPKAQVFSDAQTSFQETALFGREEYTLTGVEQPERVIGEAVSDTYFPVLGWSPAIGRPFTETEATVPGSHTVIVLGHAFWQRRFGGTRDVLGSTVQLSGTTYEVIGVMPATFTGLTATADFWVPIASLGSGTLGNPIAHSISMVARLAPSATVEQARREVVELGRIIDQRYPDTGAAAPWGAEARSLNEVRADPTIQRSSVFLMVAVALVLLVACANLAGLLLSRSLARQREMTVRLAVGAGRARLVRQLLTESLVLAAFGGLMGIGLAIPTVAAIRRAAPEASGVFASDISGLTQLGISAISIDPWVVLFGIFVTGLTGIVFGLVPALRATRQDMSTVLRNVADTAAGKARWLDLREGFVAFEIALTCVLLIGASLSLRSLNQLLSTDVGFEREGVLTFAVSPPGASYSRETGHVLLAQLTERLGSLPGVSAVGFNICTPLSSGCNGTGISFPNRPGEQLEVPNVEIHFISPDYFEALGIRVRQGRAFEPRDRWDAARVAIVNETAVRTYWPGSMALGALITVGQGGPDARSVVGVVDDVRYETLQDVQQPAVYIPVEQSGRRGGFFLIRTSGDPASLVPAIRSILRDLDPNITLADVQTMSERVAGAVSPSRFSATLVGAYAVVTLLLAAVGIYGAIAYAVARRTREIGIRMAIGASHAKVAGIMISRGLRMMVAGLMVGVVAGLALSRTLEVLLFEIEGTDPSAFAIAVGSLAVVTLIASYLPARRAMRVSPIRALKID